MLLPIRWPIHTIATANKIEKLTYSAQTRVVDPRSRVEQLKKEQDEELKNVIKEEREAEQVRDDVLQSINDAREKRNLDSVSHFNSGTCTT